MHGLTEADCVAMVWGDSTGTGDGRCEWVSCPSPSPPPEQPLALSPPVPCLVPPSPPTLTCGPGTEANAVTAQCEIICGSTSTVSDTAADGISTISADVSDLPDSEDPSESEPFNFSDVSAGLSDSSESGRRLAQYQHYDDHPMVVDDEDPSAMLESTIEHLLANPAHAARLDRLRQLGMLGQLFRQPASA